MQRIHTILLAAFEPDAGPVPGELTLLRERLRLTERMPLEAAWRPLYSDGDGTLALATGVGAARAAASVMALGLDQRFDLTSAQIIITGVCGITPEQGSLASVVLPRFVVDGDLTHEIDAREIPSDWLDGFVPIGKTMPYEEPRANRFNDDDGIVFELDEDHIARSFEALRPIDLLDSAAMAERRMQFTGSHAREAPRVMRGDEISSSTFFHGHRMSERATRWMRYQTEGCGVYAITAMEDAGMLQSLKFLSAAGRMDFARVVIVRGASNYDQQRTGITAAQSLAETRVATYSAYRPALENAARAVCALAVATRKL